MQELIVNPGIQGESRNPALQPRFVGGKGEISEGFPTAWLIKVKSFRDVGLKRVLLYSLVAIFLRGYVKKHVSG